jgi:hypothetical protein
LGEERAVPIDIIIPQQKLGPRNEKLAQRRLGFERSWSGSNFQAALAFFGGAQCVLAFAAKNALSETEAKITQ